MPDPIVAALLDAFDDAGSLRYGACRTGPTEPWKALLIAGNIHWTSRRSYPSEAAAQAAAEQAAALVAKVYTNAGGRVAKVGTN